MRPKLVRELVAFAALVAVWLVAPRAAHAKTDAMSSLASLTSVGFSAASFASSASSEASAPEEDARLTSENAPAPVGNPRNAAPLCDPRGATTFAPPPQLQDAERSLEMTTDCAQDEWSARLSGRQVERGRAPQGQADTSSQEPTIASGLLALGCGAGVRVPAPSADAERPPTGHRTLLDRPPRAA